MNTKKIIKLLNEKNIYYYLQKEINESEYNIVIKTKNNKFVKLNDKNLKLVL